MRPRSLPRNPHLRGRHVTLEEAEDLGTILAREDRVAFDEGLPITDRW